MNTVNDTLHRLRVCRSSQIINDVTLIEQAIEAIEYLQEQLKMQTALAQNGQSTIDTSARLAEEVFKLTDENKKYKDYIVSLLKENIDVCSYCVHDKECKGEKCEYYIEGVGATGENGENYPEFKWKCTDFVFGECPFLENTPCYRCVENDNKGFEWKGIE